MKAQFINVIIVTYCLLNPMILLMKHIINIEKSSSKTNQDSDSASERIYLKQNFEGIHEKSGDPIKFYLFLLKHLD